MAQSLSKHRTFCSVSVNEKSLKRAPVSPKLPTLFGFSKPTAIKPPMNQLLFEKYLVILVWKEGVILQHEYSHSNLYLRVVIHDKGIVLFQSE